jgi:hypothetical protein
MQVAPTLEIYCLLYLWIRPSYEFFKIYDINKVAVLPIGQHSPK